MICCKLHHLESSLSLFSQDAGNPVVYNGLLYWPFEDPRRSAGTVEFAVTARTPTKGAAFKR